ncbi:MAG: hypothetical protein AMXMBFR36_26290 [Acidobacteriota bacterium]
MRNPRWWSLVWLVGISVSPSAAQNALLNPDFGVDVAGWQTFLGSLDLDPMHEDADGCPESSSGRLVAASQSGPEFLGLLQATDSCLDVAPLQEVWIDATLWLRSAGFVAVGLILLEYTDDACTTFLDPPVQTAIELSVGSTPEAEHLSVTTSAGVESVGLQIDTGAIVPNALLLDRLYLGTAERVFADDFEGGSTCRWSAGAI